MLKYRVTPEDVATFNDKGCWVSPVLLTDEEIRRLRIVHERMENGNIHDGDGYPMEAYGPPADKAALRQLNNGWWVYDSVHAAVTDPAIGRIAADLLGVDSIRLWHDQVLHKPGLGGKASTKGNVGWHQDYAYWQCCSTSHMVTAWIALQDTTSANGGMKIVHGSHQWGLLPDSGMFHEQNLDKLKQILSSEGRAWIEEPIELKAGQISFHHSLTLHGSGENLSGEPRLSVVAHLMPGDTRFRAGVQWHGNIKFLGPRPRDGQLFDTAYFPLVYERKNRRAEPV